MRYPSVFTRKISQRDKESFVQVRQLLAMVLLCLSVLAVMAAPVPTGKPATYPAWWFSRGVISQNDANGSPTWPGDYPVSDDFAVMNQGQLKNFATQAYNEIQAKAPAWVWSTSQGVALSNLITNWNPTNGDAYAVVNLGQLKTVAAPFYNVLIQIGYTNNYPWTGTGADDYAAANIGQAKKVFSFDVGLDSDSNSLPDWWEIKYLGHLGNSAAANPDGNTYTLLQDYQNGLDPNNYYSQLVGGGPGIITPILSKTGDNQTSSPGAFTPLPLQVHVTNSSGGAVLVNAPVIFTVTVGGGQVAATSGGTTSISLLVQTDSSGNAQVYYLQPGGNNVSSTITATSGGQTVTFTELTSGGAATPSVTPAPGTYDLQQTVTLSDATTGATIYYTLDGTPPTTGSSSVASGGTVLISQTETLKAMAVANGFTNSAIFTAAYTINYPGVPVTGMALWFKADAGVTADGSGNVSQWVDQINGVTVTQATSGVQPTFTPNSFNGKPGVAFNGSQRLTAANLVPLDSDFTIIMSGASNDISSERYAIGIGEVTAAGACRGFGNYANNIILATDNYYTAPVSFLSAGEDNISEVYYSKNTSTATFYERGSLVGSGGGVLTSTTVSGVNIGDVSNGNYPRFWNGVIHEILVYNRALTASERQNVEVYLAAKYQLSIQATAPIISPNGGMFASSQNVSISNPPFPEVVRYTTDGTQPSATSPQYTTSFAVTSDTLVTAAVFLNGVKISPSSSAQFYLDSDGNGLPDSWEIQYFGHIGNNPTSDLNGNGLTLLQDYYTGISPVATESSSGVSVSLVSPTAGSTFFAGSTFPATARASGATHVAFFLDSTYLGSSSAVPYTCAVSNQVVGSHVVTAVAVAASGNFAVATAPFTSIDQIIDGSGLPAWWQLQYFGHLGVDPNADPDGDGLTNLQEYQNGTDPTDYYNGQAFTLSIAQGNNQSGWTGRYLDLPMQVLVTKNGTPMVHAPVQFSTGTASGLLSTNLSLPSSSTITATTDSSGIATVYYYQPDDLAAPTPVQATAGKGPNAQTANFTVDVPTAPDPNTPGTPPPGTLPPPLPNLPSDGSVQLYTEVENASKNKVGFNTFTTTSPPQIYLAENNWDQFSGPVPQVNADELDVWDPMTGTETTTLSGSITPDMFYGGGSPTETLTPTSDFVFGPYGDITDSYSRNLSFIYSTDQLIKNTIISLPTFTGNLTSDSKLASYKLDSSELFFSISKLQYQFGWSSTDRMTINYLIVFTPDSSSFDQTIRFKKMSWTGVAANFPLLLIDPTTQTYDNGSPTNRNGTIAILPIMFTITRPNAPASEVAQDPTVATAPTNTVPRDEIVNVELKIPPLANQDLIVMLDVTPDSMKTQTLATPSESRGAVQMFDFGLKNPGGTITAKATQVTLKASDSGDETFAAVFNKEGTLNIKATFSIGSSSVTIQSQSLTITKQIRKYATSYASDPTSSYDYNQYDGAFQNAASYWGSFYQHQIDDVDRLKAMGMVESEEGHGTPNYTGGQNDIMSWGNPADPDIHVIHNDGTQSQEWEIVIANNTERPFYYPQAVNTPSADAILWATCILYHKAQTLTPYNNDANYSVSWKAWDSATTLYNSNSIYLPKVQRAFLEGKHPTDPHTIWPIETDGSARP